MAHLPDPAPSTWTPDRAPALTPARTEQLAADLRHMRALAAAPDNGRSFELGYLKATVSMLVRDLAGVQAAVLVNAALEHEPTAEETAAALNERAAMLAGYSMRVPA